jgi:eukaryotic-like serine/threonine-protein kinase
MAADWDKQAGRPGAPKEGARPGQGGRTPAPVSASTEPIPLTSAITQPPVPGGPTLEVGERLANRFTIVRFIARGGMGAVYEAEDTVLRTRVAVKTILPEFAADPTAMERFRREVLLARRVTHLNICRMFELYEAVDARGERLNFLSMELLLGETLAQRLTRTGPMASYELFVLLRQMADGLEAMHIQDVIHRDFKPANVFLMQRASELPGHQANASMRAVITDFGIARALHSSGRQEQDASVTSRVGFIGTPAYMAPEQLTGGTLSAATDIYALGVVLYEALTGTVPFSGETALEAAMKRLHQSPPVPSALVKNLDPRWDVTILRCLEREPQKRFRSVLDVVRAVGQQTLDPRKAVAVLGFRNLAGRLDGAWLSMALVEMLTREFQEASQTLRTLPSEEVGRAQRALVLGAQDTLPLETLERLRDSTGAQLAVLGSYLCLGNASASALRLAVRVQDTTSGEVIAVWGEKGTVGELQAMASRAGAELRATLSAPDVVPAA